MKPSLHFQSRAGEDISKAWRRVSNALTFAPVRLSRASRMTKRVTPTGTIIRNISSDTWDHPFRVSAGNTYLMISPGTVNGIMPYISDAFTGSFVRLNGRNQSGKYDPESGSVGVAKIDLSQVNSDGGIYILLRILRNKTSGFFGTIMDKEDNVTAVNPEDCKIVQAKEFEGPTAAGISNQYGYHPLGFIQMDSTRQVVLSVSQVCHHNLRYAFQDRRATLSEIVKNPKQLTVGRHMFWPV